MTTEIKIYTEAPNAPDEHGFAVNHNYGGGADFRPASLWGTWIGGGQGRGRGPS